MDSRIDTAGIRAILMWYSDDECVYRLIERWPFAFYWGINSAVKKCEESLPEHNLPRWGKQWTYQGRRKHWMDLFFVLDKKRSSS